MKRRHHYVSRFLLNKFSDANNKIYMFDKKEHTIKNISTADAAVKKDYYRVKIEGFPEDVYENAYSEIEGPVSLIIKNICETKKFPIKDQEINYLFLFIAFLASRIPTARDNANNFIEEVIRKSGQRIIENSYTEMKEELLWKNPSRNLISKEDLKKLLADKNRVSIQIANEMQMNTVSIITDSIFKSLFQRNWYIAYVSDNMSNRFITSDSPVLLYFKEKMPSVYSPGFLVPNTVLSIALDPQTLLCSEMEETPTFPVRVNNFIIRENNYLTMHLCGRYVFSHNDNFNMLNELRNPCSSKEYFNVNF